MYIFSQIRNLLITIEQKVKEREVLTNEQVKEALEAEISKAYLYKTKLKKGASTADINFALLSAEQIDTYLNTLKDLEEKLQQPNALSANGNQSVEEKELNRQLLLILNRLPKHQ